MILRIKKQLINLIKEKTWIDDISKKKTIEKVKLQIQLLLLNIRIIMYLM